MKNNNVDDDIPSLKIQKNEKKLKNRNMNDDIPDLGLKFRRVLIIILIFTQLDQMDR